MANTFDFGRRHNSQDNRALRSDPNDRSDQKSANQSRNPASPSIFAAAPKFIDSSQFKTTQFDHLLHEVTVYPETTIQIGGQSGRNLIRKNFKNS